MSNREGVGWKHINRRGILAEDLTSKGGTTIKAGETVWVTRFWRGRFTLRTDDGRFVSAVHRMCVKEWIDPENKRPRINGRAIDLLKEALSSARLERCAVSPEHQAVMRIYLDTWVAGRIERALDIVLKGTMYDPKRK